MYFHVTNKCKSVQRSRSADDSSTIVILQTYKHVIRQSKNFLTLAFGMKKGQKNQKPQLKILTQSRIYHLQ